MGMASSSPHAIKPVSLKTSEALTDNVISLQVFAKGKFINNSQLQRNGLPGQWSRFCPCNALNADC
jgi:hypothetical protein